MHKLAFAFVALLVAAGCDNKVRQQQPPRIPDEDPASSDMGELEKKEIDVDETKEVKETAEQKHSRCCGECAKALANDRSGDKPDKIPCADFTADLSEECLKHFRKKATMATEAKACAPVDLMSVPDAGTASDAGTSTEAGAR